jgi:hypothetical protein
MTQDAELPPLPAPTEGMSRPGGYDASDMRSYARSAMAPLQARLAEAEKLLREARPYVSIAEPGERIDAFLGEQG